jgi:hypothetical protein
MTKIASLLKPRGDLSAHSGGEVYQKPPCTWLDERSPHVKAERKSAIADESLCVRANLLNGRYCRVSRIIPNIS